MSNSVAKLVNVDSIRWWCPGCERRHTVPTKQLAPDGWDFNGDYDKPTLSPSVLVYSHLALIDPNLEGDALTAPENVRQTPNCHTFIRDGRIEFLSDCTHALAGATVAMEPVSEWNR